MSDEDKGMIGLVLLWLLLITFLVWINWQPHVTPALADEPCLRVTTGTYTRNYPPDGAVLTRRPSAWATCPPFSPYQEP